MSATAGAGGLGAAACWYSKNLGWKVFPCHSVTDGHCTCGEPACKDAGKHPRTAHGLLDASGDPAVIAEWWRRWPEANLALATGAPSGVDVLDSDPRHGGDDALRELEAKHGELPATLSSLTGGGGTHYFFQHTPGLKNSAGKIGPGLDFRGDGGYVILPPSNHLSGRQYCWEGASRPEDIGAVSIPAELLKLARGSSNGNGHGKHAAKIPDVVADGTKHHTIVSLAGTLRSKGLPREGAFAACRALKFESAVSDADIWERVDSVYSLYAPAAISAASAPDLLPFLHNDHGNAERLIALHGAELRYCYAIKKWIVWDGRRWAVDAGGQAEKLGKETALKFLTQAVQTGNGGAEKFAKASLDQKRIATMLSSAECELPITPAELDTHPEILNFLNGSVDLQTGELLRHTPADFITKLVHHNYNAAAKCPLFLEFLGRIMGATPDASGPELNRADRLIAYLRKALGYSTTGNTSEKTVFILHGAGNNGKTCLLSTIYKLIEEYSMALQVDSLMVRQDSNNSQADLADLRGARFVMTSETEEGQRLAEGKLKRITQGMGKIKAVRKYENPITFEESHKLWMDANHRPDVRGVDAAIWNRLHLIPFNVTIPDAEIDRELPRKLLAEAEGILAWMVQGAVRWSAEGLGRPPEVSAARDEWRHDCNQVARFVDENCIVLPTVQAKARNLYAAYRQWAEGAGERVESETKFSLRLVALGYTKEHARYGTVYTGIGFRADHGNAA